MGKNGSYLQKNFGIGDIFHYGKKLKLLTTKLCFLKQYSYFVLEKVRAVEFLNILSFVVVSGHELIVSLTVIVSAKSANWVNLLSVNLDKELIVRLLHNNFFLTADNLNEKLLRVLVDLLGKNSESWLFGAILGNKRVAGGEWSTVDHVVKGRNLRLVNLAGGSGLFPGLLEHGTTSNSWENDAWNTNILQLNFLFWSLDGHVHVLAGKWLNRKLKNDAAILVLDTLLRNSPEVVCLDKVENAGESVFRLWGELVLRDNIDLVKTSSLDQKFVLWNSLVLTLDVAEELLLFRGLFELSIEGDLALL
nr:protein F56B6.1 [imported] - Caenorhabditis elegans [Caenorhabditis elegans]